MPKIETKEHDLDPGKDEDIILKTGNFRIYFQNYYTLISLINDLFTGALYLTASILQLFTDYSRLGMYMYLFGAVFLLMRPLLKIAHNIFLYKEDEYQSKVLGKDTEEEIRRGEGESDQPTKEVEIKSDSQDKDDSDDEISKDYNEDYYGSGEN